MVNDYFSQSEVRNFVIFISLTEYFKNYRSNEMPSKTWNKKRNYCKYCFALVILKMKRKSQVPSYLKFTSQ